MTAADSDICADSGTGVASGEWIAEPDRLDRVLPALGLARSRSQAAELIASGRVRVNAASATKAGMRVATGSTVEVHGRDHYVSRAAHKLIAGLDAFEVRVDGRLALDVGASTGGFTQVLLERGAREVLALDVGHGQLVDELRHDPRVRVVEGCNARELTKDRLAELAGVAESPQLIVADLSFISLSLVLPALAAVAAPGAEMVLLVKPQFEVGRQGVRDGIVVDPLLAAEAVRGVLRAAEAVGYRPLGLIASPIAGGSGNQEYVVHFVPGASPDQTEWEGWIREHIAGSA